MLKAKEKEPHQHRRQPCDSDTGGRRNHASQCEDKAIKSEAEHEKIPRTAFSVSTISIHATSVQSKRFETYMGMGDKAIVL